MLTDSPPLPLPPGTYTVAARCPNCLETALILVAVRVVLTVPDDDVATLRVRTKAKPVDHRCGQTAVAFDVATGEVLTP
jgi:hypothetical protein